MLVEFPFFAAGINYFPGEISALRYFNSALNPVEIASISRSGPNMCSDSSKPGPPPYFSNRWYTVTN